MNSTGKLGSVPVKETPSVAGASGPAILDDPKREVQETSKPNRWVTLIQIVGILAIVIGAFWLGTQRELVQRFSQWGYLSSFIISLIGSATVILPAPGLALILALGAHLNPVLLGTVAGIGAGLGELSGYLAGKTGRDLVNSQGKLNSFLLHVTTRFTTPALFILAILPLPIFDFAGILAGALRFPVLKFLGVVICGKIIKHVLAAYLGAEFFEMLMTRLGV